MSDPNFIRIDVSGGWLEQLIKEIDKNRDFSISCANQADLSEEDRYNYKCMAERDARVKEIGRASCRERAFRAV